jgi:menaquinone-dependent protoporphyrinogen oxidase
MGAILLVCSTTDGHTRKICDRVRAHIDSDCNRVTLIPIEQAPAVDLSAFDKVVVGASIRYGKHSRLVRAFVDANASVLETKPSAFFSVNLVARRPDKNQPENNPYMRRFLQQSRWRPKEVDVFAGKLDYPRYGFIDRLVIRLIMLITNGPTDPTTVVEFTDWQRVAAFAERVATM